MKFAATAHAWLNMPASRTTSAIGMKSSPIEKRAST